MKRVIICLIILLFGLSSAHAEEMQSFTICTDSSDISARLISAFSEENPDLRIHTVDTETITREMVIKTRIASNEPVDVAIYWGTRLNSFSDIGMCKDLTPYIDPEWLQVIDQDMLIRGSDGKIYGIPYNAIYHVMFYNLDMMRAYGFSEPETWSELTDIFAQLKKDGIYGFCTNSVSMQDSMYGLTYPQLEAIGEGHSLAFANGEYSVIGTPEGQAIQSVIELVQDWYQAGYWYADNNIVTSAQSANAAFAQEKCMFVFNSCDELDIHLQMCDFEVGVMLKPVQSKGMLNFENLETKVLFIPNNASDEQTELALRFLRFATSQKGQQIVADASAVPACPYDIKGSDLLMKITSFKQNAIANINPCRYNPAMQNFLKQEIFTSPCLGIRSVQEMLNEIERIFMMGKQQ